MAKYAQRHYLYKLHASFIKYGWTSNKTMNFFLFNKKSETLKPDLNQRFLNVVANTDWQLLKRGDCFEPTSTKEAVVICVAVWSHPDIEALEAFRATSEPTKQRVCVFSLHDFTFEEIIYFMPGIKPFTKTPVMAEYRNGHLLRQLEGQAAIDWMEIKTP